MAKEPEYNDDPRELILLDWGNNRGKVIRVLREHLGYNMREIQRFTHMQPPIIIACESMVALQEVLTALEDAGAHLDIQFVTVDEGID